MAKNNIVMFPKQTDSKDGKGISELAQKHAAQFYEELRAETFISTMQGIGDHLERKNWEAIKALLDMCFMTILERKPFALVALMENEEDFQTYCQHLYESIKTYG